MQLISAPRIIAQVPSAIVARETTNTDKVKAARIREMGLDLARKRREEKKRSRPGLGRLMHYDFNKFLCDTYDKHGPAMPEGDNGAEEHFGVLLHLTANLGDPSAVWAAQPRWCPWMSEAAFTAIVDKVYAKPLRWRADTLAHEIGLNDATRTRVGITSIGANDFNKEQRIERRNANKLAKRKAKRRAARALRLMAPKKAKPWVVAGMSRTSWYAKGKPQFLDSGQKHDTQPTLLPVLGVMFSSEQEGAAPQGDLTRSDSDEHVVLVAELSAADDLIQSQTKRDAAGAGRLHFKLLKNSKNACDMRPLQASYTKQMGARAA
jgi:hypothetical protein